MKLFIDTANIDEIREINEWGILSGVTTNPSLIAKEGRDSPPNAPSAWPLLRQQP